MASGSAGCVRSCMFAGPAVSGLLQLSQFVQSSQGTAVLFYRVTYLYLLQIMVMLAALSGFIALLWQSISCFRQHLESLTADALLVASNYRYMLIAA